LISKSMERIATNMSECTDCKCTPAEASLEIGKRESKSSKTTQKGRESKFEDKLGDGVRDSRSLSEEKERKWSDLFIILIFNL
ncbi:hypothetical protein Lal_00019769, partial [Lupinus albus]